MPQIFRLARSIANETLTTQMTPASRATNESSKIKSKCEAEAELRLFSIFLIKLLEIYYNDYMLYSQCHTQSSFRLATLLYQLKQKVTHLKQNLILK